MPHQIRSSQSVRAMHTTLRRWKFEVQVLVRAPFHVFVADLERHLSCKKAHVGANPTEGSISNTLHIVIVSIPRCERGGAGATPAVGTISSSCARQRAEPAVCNTALPSASLGRTSTFHRIRESRRTHLVWDPEAPGAAPGYPTISKQPCSSKSEHAPLKRRVDGASPSRATIFMPL